MPDVTVAIPTRNGGPLFARTLTALGRQTVEHELLVCDSGSSDDSIALARRHGARVIEIAPSSFAHGATRNLLMREAQGEHVALLTQDAEPAHEHWLEHLLGGFRLAEDVGLVYGPYTPRPDAPLTVSLELERWFASLAGDGQPQLERLAAHERTLAPRAFVGRRGFFSDANACVSRLAWREVPFRELAYAEDRALALDMLRAGFAKVFVPAAQVIHSHAFTPSEQLRRAFDEWRGLLEVYGWREPLSPARAIAQLRGELGYAGRRLAERSASPGSRAAVLAGIASHSLLRQLGAQLGSHADRLPAPLRRALSLERRSGLATAAGCDGFLGHVLSVDDR